MDKELFVEYHKLKMKAERLGDELADLVEEETKHFIKTQPKASDTSKEIVIMSSGNSNKFLNYTINTELLSKQVQEKKNELGAINYRRKMKLMELRDSKEELDRIYVYRYINGYPIRKFYKLVHLSKRQTYRKLEEIREKLKNGTK